jgi:HSP20 family protein
MTFRYDPFEQMNRLFEQTRQSVWDGIDTNVSVEQTDEGYVVMADLPGFEKEDIELQFDDGVLTIEGEVAVDETAGPATHRRRQTVHERLSIPGPVLVDDITASYHNGVLEVTLPTEEDAADVHRIDID